MATVAQRHHLLRLMELLEEHATQIHYPPGDVRGAADQATWLLTESQLVARLKGGESITADCSALSIKLYHLVGIDPHHHFGSSHPGYTGTIIAYGQAHDLLYTDPEDAGIGAPCIFGPQGGEHMSLVKRPGADPVMFSHGRPGIDVMKLSSERQGHAPPVRFCSIAHL